MGKESFLSLNLMAALFLMIFATVALVQDRRLFKSVPKDMHVHRIKATPPKLLPLFVKVFRQATMLQRFGIFGKMLHWQENIIKLEGKYVFQFIVE